MTQITAAIMPPAYTTFLDGNGAPVSGGSVGFFVPGTSTKKDTWQDPLQVTLNLNPVILDGDGKALIYGNGQYRQIVYDAVGNVVWDNLTYGLPPGDSDAQGFGAATVVPAAATIDLGLYPTKHIYVSNGAGSITDFGSSASTDAPIYLVYINTTVTIVNNVTTLRLPGGVNINALPGDYLMMDYRGSGVWNCMMFQPAIGYPRSDTVNAWNNENTFNKQTDSPFIPLVIAGATFTPDFSTGNNFSAGVGANFTMANPTNAKPGQSGVFRIQQTAVSIVVTWGSAFVASGGIATQTLTGTSGAIDYFAFLVKTTTEIVLTAVRNVSH